MRSPHRLFHRLAHGLSSNASRLPAAVLAGLLVSDVITSVGGTAVTDVNALPRVVAKLPLGQKTEVVFVRDGKAFSLDVAVEEQPDDFAPRKDAPAPPPKLDPGVKLADAGLTVVDMTAQIAAQLRYPAGLTPGPGQRICKYCH